MARRGRIAAAVAAALTAGAVLAGGSAPAVLAGSSWDVQSPTGSSWDAHEESVNAGGSSWDSSRV